MNREIKFRAWDSNIKEIVEVVSVDLENEFIRGISQVENNVDLESSYSFDEIELMQYAGLKDKNGTEIYEGDIVRLQSVDGMDYNAQIVFKDGGFCAIDGAIDDFSVSRYNLTIFDLEITVIGNIYENSELLEVDEE